jgi:hypothetical protein
MSISVLVIKNLRMRFLNFCCLAPKGSENPKSVAGLRITPTFSYDNYREAKRYSAGNKYLGMITGIHYGQ